MRALLNAFSQMVSIISMNLTSRNKRVTIVHRRLWNMVHGSNLDWNRCINRQIKQRLTWLQMRTRNCAEKTERDFPCPICPLCYWSSRFLDLSSSCILDPGEWSLSLVNLRSRQREAIKRTAKSLCVTNVTGLLTLLCSGLLQKDLFKGRWSLAEIFSNIIIVTIVTTQVLPFFCVSSLFNV